MPATHNVRIIRGLPAVADQPVALTIGNFDGVHRGHQAMLTRLIEAAEDLCLPPAVLTFDPHPREFFAPDGAPARLSTLRGKLELFSAYGVARTYIARFDAALAALTPDAFVDDVLVRRLATRWVLVGDDFRFGRARAGDLATLRRHARRFSVEAMGTVDVDGERASSTAVREALARGELAHAAALLGRPYAISGRVAHGTKLGRTLGFPTANLCSENELLPPHGVYATTARIGGIVYPSVTNVGTRPTVDTSGRTVIETHVFDFDRDLYGQAVRISFVQRLRDERAFASLDELRAQIEADSQRARVLFNRLSL